MALLTVNKEELEMISTALLVLKGQMKADAERIGFKDIKTPLLDHIAGKVDGELTMIRKDEQFERFRESELSNA